MAIFGEIQTSNDRQKYSAGPITLSHDGILTKGFSCKWWDAVDADRGIARVNHATRAPAIGINFADHFI
jgi:hypothetical protein